LGIGGSALGPIALQQAINSPFYNLCEQIRLCEKIGGYRPKLFVMDNIDPATISDLLAILDLEKTLFSVVSKSGGTAETMSQFAIIKQMLEEKLGPEKSKGHIVCTTDKEQGILLDIAKKEGYKTFYIPRGVGGRFSQLCPVGLLPAAFCGIDIKALLEGAEFMDKLCQNPNLKENPAYTYAALHIAALKEGKNISVMMPYADSLKFMADWYAQLWAESLGKRYDLEGKEVFTGQSVIKALGTTDQHSQIQLFNEGPFDKIITFLAVEDYKTDIPIPTGHTLAKLLKAQQKGTADALTTAKRPNLTITLPIVNEHTMGQLFQFLMISTAFAGGLLNINPFDQPGVEAGKSAARAALQNL
jgi:glucose-6-phosphate isomerase